MESIKMSNFSSAEISYLWTTYQFETMSKCTISHWLQHIEDEPTKELLLELEALSSEIIERLLDIFDKESYPVPMGFSEKDVNLKAPRLFSDALYLEMILQKTKLTLPLYQAAFIEMTRVDLEQFYQNIIEKLMKLVMRIKQLAIEKGQYIPYPRIPNQKQIEMVQKDGFLAGWFGDKRPLLGMEIANLVFNAKRNGVGHAAITGFSQVAKSKEVRKYFERGKGIALNQMTVFTQMLQESDLPQPSFIWTSEVTDSTIAPFSDRLMMQAVATLIASGMANYGQAMSMSARRDLGITYTKLSAEVALFSDDGAEILIKNGWMEQPPIAANRKKLAK